MQAYRTTGGFFFSGLEGRGLVADPVVVEVDMASVRSCRFEIEDERVELKKHPVEASCPHRNSRRITLHLRYYTQILSEPGSHVVYQLSTSLSIALTVQPAPGS